MKKYYILLIGIALLVVNIEISVIKYPVFEEFQTEAPITVSMVIDHNVGTHMPVDIASDIVGFLLIMVATMAFLADSRDYDENDTKVRRRTERSRSHFQKLYFWCVCGIVCYLAKKIMPFYLNGNLRFRAEYLVYFAYLFVNLIVILNAFLGVTALFESVENHSYNNITIIFGLISIICFMVAGVLYFFDIMIGFFIYYALSIGVMGYAIYRIYSNIQEA